MPDFIHRLRIGVGLFTYQTDKAHADHTAIAFVFATIACILMATRRNG